MSAHTSPPTAHDLDALAEFCDAGKIADWAALEHAQVRTFAAAAHAAGLAPRSIQRRLSAVRTFYEFLMREGALHSAIRALDVRAPKRRSACRRPSMPIRWRGCWHSAPTITLSARDKAIMELFYSSGLRLAELVGLDVQRLDLGGPHRAGARQGQQDAHRARRPSGHRAR